MPGASSATGDTGTDKDVVAKDRIAAGKRPTAAWKAKLALRGRRLRHRLRNGARYPDEGVVNLLDSSQEDLSGGIGRGGPPG
eukprot:2317677-Lingulodinium_polyedra.AAC.1